jgi:flagellin
VTWDSTNRVINITIDDNETTTLAAVRTAVQNLSIDGVTPFSASTISTPGHSRTRLYGGAGADIDAAGNTGSTGGNTLFDDLVIQLAGRDGAQVFTFQAGATINSIVNAINGQTDSTGLVATMAVASGAATLSIRSSDYGSEAFAAVDIIREGVNGRFADLLSARRASGTDIVASVNGMLANGRGNTLSLNTALLSMTATVNDGSSTDFSFVITGGGAVFQLGPDVVSAQQSRIGIPSVNTAKLGGRHGRLYQLASGEAASLENDPTTAMRIVDEVLTKVNTLRGRLGAFQKTTVETNNKTLTDTVENLVSAESLIRDADFASETAALVRAQILVQSGTAVLSIANRNPEAVLALLR